MTFTNAQIDAITGSAAELSDKLTDLTREWVQQHIDGPSPMDALAAVSGGALLYSLAECCGQFIRDEDLEKWAALMCADLVNISRAVRDPRKASTQ